MEIENISAIYFALGFLFWGGGGVWNKSIRTPWVWPYSDKWVIAVAAHLHRGNTLGKNSHVLSAPMLLSDTVSVQLRAGHPAHYSCFQCIPVDPCYVLMYTAKFPLLMEMLFGRAAGIHKVFNALCWIYTKKLVWCSGENPWDDIYIFMIGFDTKRKVLGVEKVTMSFIW